jgi:hypothetical protein
MTLQKRVPTLCGIVIGLVLIIWKFWPAPAFVSSVGLPEGVSLTEALRAGKEEAPQGWHTNIYCQGSNQVRPAPSPSTFLEGIRYGIHEALGRTLYKVPNPPRCDYLTPRLGECHQASGEKYLLAKELVWEVAPPPAPGSDFTFLCFVWGGTNRLRHARDIVAVTEDGILKSGIFGMRWKWSLPQQRGVKTTEYISTNQCAVIRDVRGLVKIVPIENLKAYADAGLITLPSHE